MALARSEGTDQRFYSMSHQIRDKRSEYYGAKLTKSSQDTAYRDITDLVQRGALRKDAGGGRSTSYSLVVDP